MIQSFTQPRAAIRDVLDYDIAERELVLAALLVACIVSVASAVIAILTADPEVTPFLGPFQEAILNFVMIMGGAVLVNRVGIAFGGRGGRLPSMKIMIWLSWISILPNMLVMFMVGTQMDLAMPVLLSINLALAIIFAVFVQTVHGFKSLFLTVIGVIGTSILFMMLLLFALGLAGVLPAAN
jgi:hypothetical protein